MVVFGGYLFDLANGHCRHLVTVNASAPGQFLCENVLKTVRMLPNVMAEILNSGQYCIKAKLAVFLVIWVCGKMHILRTEMMEPNLLWFVFSQIRSYIEQTATQSQPGGSEMVNGVWDMASNWLASPPCDWLVLINFGIASVATVCRLTWPGAIFIRHWQSPTQP